MEIQYRFDKPLRYSDLLIGLAVREIREIEVAAPPFPPGGDGYCHTLAGQGDRIKLLVMGGGITHILSLGSGIILKCIEHDFNNSVVGSTRHQHKPITHVDSEEAFGIYWSLPQEDRDVASVIERFEECGYNVLPGQVRDCIQNTLVQQFTDEEIAATARTLRLLADLEDCFWGNGRPGEHELEVGRNFVRSLSERVNASKLDSLAFAIARFLTAHHNNEAVREQCG